MTKRIIHPVKFGHAKAKLFNGVKYSLMVTLLSMSLAFAPAASNCARAADWWQQASDGGLNEVGKAYGQSGTPTADYDIRLMVARIIRIVLELLGIIFLVLIIYAGFKWMTAGGDEEKVTSAKKLLTNSVIGLIIIFAAFAIATFVFYQLEYAITGIKPITWSW
ncbi:MAG: hypothetical protein AUK20_03265 [Parcubacteria group bacterium CG2_30_45_37]|nr:MAG: hypothetical protein AUK20_03265 [Parcubacteria group bacterium CG2_30_45_37]